MNKRDIVYRMIDKLAGHVYSAALAAKFSPGQGLPEIVAEYRETLYKIMDGYMTGERPVTAFRNEMRRAANEAFTFAGYAGYVDGGGRGGLPDKVISWINQRIDNESQFIGEVFAKLRDLRKNGTPGEQQAFILARVDGYAASVPGVYNFAKMNSGTGIMGIWKLGPTEKHCKSGGNTTGCEQLDGTIQTLKWFVERGYIPRQPGNKSLTCGGWECLCGIYDVENGALLV